MAEIRPFRGWRYNELLSESIQDLCFPLQLASDANILLSELNENNIIQLARSENPDKAAQILSSWKINNILKQDSLPGLYPYSITYRDHHDHEKQLTGFICNIRIREWEEKVILRHENILPGSVNELTELLHQLKLHITPSHGLYSDPQFKLESILQNSLKEPLYEFTDRMGMKHSFSIIEDPNVIIQFVELIKDKSIILADGHHRYSASLKNLHCSHGKSMQAAQWHPMFLTNTENNQFSIYPIHRLIKKTGYDSYEELIKKLNSYFSVEIIKYPNELESLLEKGEKYNFGIILRDINMILTLKKGLEKTITWPFPEMIKNLDLTVLHYFLIEKCLNAKGKDQKDSKNINFSYNFTNAVKSVLQGENEMALITQSVSMNEIKLVCKSGFTLPHKSTWFLPKVISGLVFSSILPDDRIIEEAIEHERKY